MLIGYGRVSTFEQNLDLQIDALKEAGADPIYTDKVSGMREVRPNWEKCFQYAREGDIIVVWKLDRRSKSGFKGVFWHTQNKKWYARLRINKKSFYLGSSIHKSIAIEIYKQKMPNYFGEFGRNII